MKDQVIQIRLSTDVMKNLKQTAEQKGLKSSAYVRMVLMDKLASASN